MLLAFGNSLKLLHFFFNIEKISCGLWMLWITNQFQKWCIACRPFYWFLFIRKQCILGLLKGQKIVLFVINMVGSDVKAYGFCWFVKLILPFFLWLWRKRKVSTFITCAKKIFVYGAKGSEMKLNVILHFLMGNLVCSGGMRFFFFLKENSGSFVSSQRVSFSCISPYLFGQFKILQHGESECITVVQILFSCLGLFTCALKWSIFHNRLLSLFYCYLYSRAPFFLSGHCLAILLKSLLFLYLKPLEFLLVHLSLLHAQFSYLHFPFVTFWVLYCLSRIRFSSL